MAAIQLAKLALALALLPRASPLLVGLPGLPACGAGWGGLGCCGRQDASGRDGARGVRRQGRFGVLEARLARQKDAADGCVPQHKVRVSPLPAWMDLERLLGQPREDWHVEVASDGSLTAMGMLPRQSACALAARLRGLGFAGCKLEFSATPPLPRTAVRNARTEDARARRATSRGFQRKGTRLDDEGKVSLTPEHLAMQLAKRVRGQRVVDATCGAGGNAIAFARERCDVTAIDCDRPRLLLARHNAAVYGVEDRIAFVHADAATLLPELSADVVFFDPPWGVEYDRVRTTLDTLPLLDKGLELLRASRRVSRVLAKVPPSFDPATTPDAKVEPWFGEGPGDFHRVKFLVLDFMLLFLVKGSRQEKRPRALDLPRHSLAGGGLAAAGDGTGGGLGGASKDFDRALGTAEAVIHALRLRAPSRQEASSVRLNVETDFFDASTGLHSEGVWHNALVGIACLGLISARGAAVDEEVEAAPGRIGAALLQHSWDGVSFRRRAHSGMWDHAQVPGTQPAYYAQSNEHRCVQHGMAVVFFSFLREIQPAAAPELASIVSAFAAEFWDEQAGLWTTIGRSQGAATASRAAASTGLACEGPASVAAAEEPDVAAPPGHASPDGAGNNDVGGFFEAGGGSDVVYYRAVDQAVALMALVSLMKRWQPADPIPREQLGEMIRVTAQQLLSPAGFGYGGNYSAADPNPWARAYMNLDRGRNLWHDGWVGLALCFASQHAREHCAVDDAMVKALFEQLVAIYGGEDGRLWHWPAAQRPALDKVKYCGDNALMYALSACLQWTPPPPSQSHSLGGTTRGAAQVSPTQEKINLKKTQKVFWDFVGSLRGADADGLACVGDAYPHVRLHPNSELAALLVWRLL